jgi:hypothetical protein
LLDSFLRLLSRQKEQAKSIQQGVLYSIYEFSAAPPATLY